LVNSAGTAISAPATDISVEDFRDMIDTDVTATFALTQLIGRSMIAAGRGSVINIASLAAERGTLSLISRWP
jgi:short-subunit dehydrogenase